MTLMQLREKAHLLHDRYIQQVYDLSGTVVVAKEQPGVCEICQGKMHSQKTFKHEGRTIAHGTFEVRETVWVCVAGCRHPSGQRVTKRADCVVQNIMPHSRVGYDVMVFIGLERYLHYRQREEIRTKLYKKRGIRLSSGEISRMARCFLDYFARLHYAKAPQLKKVLDSDGGWPMQVDATGENGRGTLLVVMAGWRKWVLGSWKIATEKYELIYPCLQDAVRRFGVPCAAMRDLGRAVIPAIDALVCELDIQIPVLACHQHFLCDIGKDLLEASHSELRNLFRRLRVLPKLRHLVRDLGLEIGGQIDEARKAVLTWQSIIEAEHQLPTGRNGLAVVRTITQWTTDYKADGSGLDFPYDRPYLDFYDRCMTALRAVDAFLRNPPEDSNVVRVARRLHRILVTVASEVPFCHVVRHMRRRVSLFDEFRDQLRLSSKLPEGESENDLNAMQNGFEEWTISLKKRRPERGPAEDLRQAIDIIMKHIDAHGINLWGHIISLPDGGIRLLDRTNDLLENLFGEMKHNERRRSGRKNLTQDLEHLPAEAVLVYNLNHSDYVSVVCGSLEQLPKVFAQMDQEERVRRQKGLIPEEIDDLKRILQLSTASMSTVDRRIIRSDNMNTRINMAANSRAPRIGY